jgi:hypothetical protein
MFHARRALNTALNGGSFRLRERFTSASLALGFLAVDEDRRVALVGNHHKIAGGAIDRRVDDLAFEVADDHW